MLTTNSELMLYAVRGLSSAISIGKGHADLGDILASVVAD